MIALLFWLCVITVFYVYAGYPLLVTILAFFSPPPRQYDHATPMVTLLIPAFNEETVIAQKLENSLSLDYPVKSLQIIVAADGSDDGTVQVVRSFVEQGVELSYDRPRRGKMAAINRAIDQARGEIIIFSDANNMFKSDVIHELLKPFTDKSVGGVSGAKTIMRGDGVLGESEGLYWKYESFIKKQETRLGCCTGVVGEIFAIRRSLIEPWPDTIINDDFYIAMRLIKSGHRIVYTEKARSLERVSLSAQDEIARRSRIIAGRYQAMAMMNKLVTLSRPVVTWQVISHKFMRPLLPLAMIGAFCANLILIFWPPEITSYPFLSLSPPVNWILLILQALFYLLAWTGNKLERSSRIGRILYLPTFLVNSNLAALIGLFRFLSQSQTTLWQRAQRPDVVESASFAKLDSKENEAEDK